jgi:hypothetical protein
LNAPLEDLAEQRGLVLFDLTATMSDEQALKTSYAYNGLHIDGAGFNAWATALAPYPFATNG